MILVLSLLVMTLSGPSLDNLNVTILPFPTQEEESTFSATGGPVYTEEHCYGYSDQSLGMQLDHVASYDIDDHVTSGAGLDVVNLGGIPTAVVVDNSDGRLEAFTISDGFHAGYWSLSSGNTNPYGACTVDAYFHVNDMTSSNIFAQLSSGWATYSNPAGNDGLDMDHDYFYTNKIFEAYWTKKIYMFDKYSTTGSVVDLSSYVNEGTYITGVGVFPFNGATGVAVSTYGSQKIFFFLRHTNGSWQYLGNDQAPVDLGEIRGIGHDYSTGYLVIHRTNYYGDHRISVLNMTPVALSRSTWGEIKSTFN